MPTITVPARLESLETAKRYLRTAIPPEFAAQTTNVLLVAEELLVNVFSYAYPEGEEGKAEVSIEVETIAGEEKLVFCVRDWGGKFNPFEEAPVPDINAPLEERPMGGLGIFLIRQVSEAQSWRYESGANCIRILFGKTTAAPEALKGGCA